MWSKADCNSSCSRPLDEGGLCLLKVVVVLSCLVVTPGRCQNVDISIPLFNISALTCSGSFQFSNDHTSVGLTPVTGNGATNQFQSARAMYAQPIQFHDRSTNNSASFSTSFVFGIYQISGGSTPVGEGMAFLIAPDPKVLPDASGGALGLFQIDGSGASIGNNSLVVAVEFDTFTNDWDKSPDNHVGVNINSVASVTETAFPNGFLTGRKIGVWIDYDAVQQLLEIRLSPLSSLSRPQRSSAQLVLCYSNFHLSAFVNEFSYVGFSAGTGRNAELNQVFSWHFATSGLPASQHFPSPPPQNDGPEGTVKRRREWEALLVFLSPLSGLLLALAAILLCWRRRNKTPPLPVAMRSKKKFAEAGWSVADLAYGPRRFTYKELSNATKGFSEVLGQGGFGTVYKGLLPDGAQVAVKQVAEHSKQGDREFRAEVTTIGRLRHRNLVEMKGWCHEQGKLLLVYDYMPNGSLDRYLFRSSSMNPDDPPPDLSWAQRFNIIKGVAAALLYLHEEWDQPVVHRDVKASNVMLDGHLNARLSDFGLARLMENNKLSETVTITAGTVGYLAPECTYTGKVSAESDVFSFGAVVLEVVGGRRPVEIRMPLEERSLVMWVWSCHMEGRLLEVVDSRLQGNYNVEQVIRVLHVGLLCTLPEPESRPTIRLALQYLMGVNPLPPLPEFGPVSLFGNCGTCLDGIDIPSLMRMTTDDFSDMYSNPVLSLPVVARSKISTTQPLLQPA